jgi:pyruvate dehydrogenase E2 component (dihydrolipoamide acetyltransferase)
MPEKILMPKLGMTMESGTITKWYKKEGDTVLKGEPIVQVLTDKSNMDVEAPVSGKLFKILAKEGDEVPVNAIIGIILLEGETEKDVKEIQETKEVNEQREEKNKGEFVENKIDQEKNNYIPSTPYAKKLAQEKGIKMEELQKNEAGIVTSKSLLNLGSEQVINLSSITKAMAERMTESNKIPQFTLYYDIYAEKLLQVNDFCKKTGYQSSITPILVKVLSELFKDFPLFRYKFDGEKLFDSGHHNIGIAVQTKSGLIVPVLKNVELLDTKSLFSNFNALIERTLNNNLDISDLEGGSFTVSNLGMFGVDSFRALLVPGQLGIIAISAIKEKVVVIGSGIFVRKVFNVSISCDHRVVDGATAARFMQSFKNFIEERLDEVVKCQ